MHKDVKSWDYFDNTVQIDGKVFDVLVNVRDKGNNQFVYNVALRANNKLRANGRLLDHEGLASGAHDEGHSRLARRQGRRAPVEGRAGRDRGRREQGDGEVGVGVKAGRG